MEKINTELEGLAASKPNIISAQLLPRFKELIGKDRETVQTGLKQILDECGKLPLAAPRGMLAIESLHDRIKNRQV